MSDPHLTAAGQPRKSTPGHGGSRPGAGRPKGSVTTTKKVGRPVKTEQGDAYTVLAKAKAKRETYKAHMAELDYRKQAGELYDRAEVMQVFTTTLAIFAEQIRSIPDALERKAGLTGKQSEMAADEIDAQLEELKRRLMAVLADG